MPKKRVTLDQVMKQEQSAEPEVGRPEVEQKTQHDEKPSTDPIEKKTKAKKGKRHADKKQQTVYLPHAVYDQLRSLAFEERTKMHTLLMEGLDRVFKNRGLENIKSLTSDKTK